MPMAVFLLQDPSGADVSAAPIGNTHISNDHALAGGCVDKLIVTQVDSQMRYTAAAGVEEHQITGFQIAFGNGSTNLVLVFADPGEFNSVDVENILHITAAVKSTGR